jgi:hypothetical protein
MTEEEQEKLDPAVLVAYHALHLLIHGAERTGQDVRDVHTSLEGFAMALGLIFEQAPENSTPAALRKSAEQFSKSVGYHAKRFRHQFEQTGVHPIDKIIDRFPAPPEAN